MNLTVQQFIQTLDTYFDRDDMRSAGTYLRDSLEYACAREDHPLRFAILNEMMGYYRKTGEVERGLVAIEEGLDMIPQLQIDGKVAGATGYLNAATTLKAFGNAKEALPYYEKAEAIFRRELSPSDPRMAGLCNNFALALVDLGRFHEAEGRYREALAILGRSDGKETDLANTYVNMAHLYEKLEDYEAIESCLNYAKDALELDQVRNGYYAYTCRKCAPSFGYFGYFVYEKELNERADGIYERP